MDIKKIVMIALAYVGVLVGAGFASGQEILQYFVAFGYQGIVGVVVAALLFGITGLIALQLGSYYFADEHMDVLDEIAHPWLAKLLDASITFTCFCIGFVMIAGAGSNLEQQFGLPIWVGALIMAGLIVLVGMMDVEKVTNVIGAITPFMIVFIVLAAIYAIATTDFSTVDQIDQSARTLPTTLPFSWVSSLNYVAMSLMCAVSMAIVMGGALLDLRIARLGGLIGGVIVGILVVIMTLALYFQVDFVRAADLPMLELINLINPALGSFMSIVILGMIFNTGVGMYYALTARISRKNPQHFRPTLIVLVIVGYGLSFLGFKRLVSVLYPLIGYIGLALIGLFLVTFFRDRKIHRWEGLRRLFVVQKMEQRIDPEQNFTRKDLQELEYMVEKSTLENDVLKDVAHSEALDNLDVEVEAGISGQEKV